MQLKSPLFICYITFVAIICSQGFSAFCASGSELHNNLKIKNIECLLEKRLKTMREPSDSRSLNESDTSSCNYSSHDAYIRAFVFNQKHKNDCIEFKDGKLVLYASVKGSEARMRAIKALCWYLATFGLVGLIWWDGHTRSYGSSSSSSGDTGCALLVIPAILLWGMTKTTVKFLSYVSHGWRNVPYLTLDSEGLMFYKQRCFKWTDVSSYTVKTYAAAQNDSVCTPCNREIEFFNKDKSLIFSLLESDIFLPIPFDDFVTLAGCYLKEFGKAK